MQTLHDTIIDKSSGRVYPKTSMNPRRPYEHQMQAMKCLDQINKKPSYSTLVVLPTGGGNTYTASMWLLKNAIDKKKKILWIAHRQMLLDQAAESFMDFAYAEVIPHISSFTFRIVSGASNHDRMIDINPKDNILIASKDSLGRNLSCLDAWLRGEDEIYLVIDEAHHSTAKTYRKVIDYLRNKVPHLKLIGLTATPFRTKEEEQGLLGRIYTDDMAYKIGLKDLIGKQILANPIFESCYTDEHYGESLGVDAWKNIQHLDIIPDDIANDMASSAARNKLIVETYAKNPKKYGQTILFAVNVLHAIQLNALFKKAGIRSDYVVSSIKDSVTGVTISSEDNPKKIEAFRNGKIQVLINVNILTEGADLPETTSVFLARPTTSTILMTQMVGRALRGTAAGGTSHAYIVSFIDHWNEHIAWVNPESLLEGDHDFHDKQSDRTSYDLRMIAISKIEEFASILDDSIDTTKLEAVPFEKRIPVGMYVFHYLEKNGIEGEYQVMVYDSTRKAYEELMQNLPDLFESFQVTDEYPEDKVLSEMEQQCRDTYFCGEMIPSYAPEDIYNILRYYALYESAPAFYTFEDVERNKLDISKIAQYICDQDMGIHKKNAYLDELWNEGDENLLRLFFSRKLYFLRQIDIEIMKITNPILYTPKEKTVDYGSKKIEDLPLHEIGKIDPDLDKQLRDGACKKALGKDGMYHCSGCGMKSKSRAQFQVDHIIPMNRGGKSIPENLQILCRKCNGTKGDK